MNLRINLIQKFVMQSCLPKTFASIDGTECALRTTAENRNSIDTVTNQAHTTKWVS